MDNVDPKAAQMVADSAGFDLTPRKKSFGEHRGKAYVAATRAVHELYLDLPTGVVAPPCRLGSCTSHRQPAPSYPRAPGVPKAAAHSL